MANRGSVANLLLRIFSQKGDAKTDVDELAGALEVLDHTKAEAKATVDTDKAAFDELQVQLDLFNHKKVDAKVGVDTAGAEAQLQLFTHSLENLKSRAFTGKLFSAGDVGQLSNMFPHQGQLSIPVDLDSGKAQAEAVALNEQLSLELHDQHVNVDIDKAGDTERAINALVSAFGSLSGVGAGVGSALSKVGESMGSVTVNIGMFGLRMGPILALVLAVAAALAISLVSALAAVAASAILAATALAAMGVALIGALAPIALIAIPAALAFGKVLQALASSHTDQTKAARDSAKATRDKAAADQSARQYAQQHADAERALADATQNAADAQKNAYREMQDAIERVKDAVLGLQEAQLGVQQSQLDFDKAKQALKDFREQAGLTGKTFDAMFKTFSDVNFDPNKLNAALKRIKVPGGTGLGADDQLKLRQLILDVKSAKLGEAGATDKVHDSEVELTRARQDAEPFLEKGINGSKAYQAALKGVADAQRNLSRVESDRAFALKNQAAQQDAAAASADAATTKTQRLSAENKKLLAAVKGLIGAFKQAFGPAITAVLDGFIAGFKILEPAIKNLRGPLTELGKAMGATITGFFQALSTPAFQNLFLALIDGAKQLLPYVDKIFVPMLDILGKIAVAAMPFLVEGFKDVAKWMGSLDKGLTVKKIGDFIKKIIPNLSTWVGLALQLIPSFFAFVVDIAPYGIQLLKWITGVAKKFKEWAESKKGRKEIHDFFSQTIPQVIAFLTLIIGIGEWFINVANWISNAADNVKKFFKSFDVNPGEFLATLFSLFRGDWVDVFIEIFKHAGKKIINALWDGMKSVGLFIKNTILGPPFDRAINWLKGVPGTLFNLGKKVINGLWNGIKSVGFSIKNFIVPKFNAAKDWLSGVPGTLFRLGKDAINGLWHGIRSIAFSIKDWVSGKFSALLNAGKWFADRMFDIGKNMAQGLWNGLKSIGFSIKDWVSGKVDSALHFLHIGSPSKLMIEMGKNVGIGFEVGINATNRRVTNAAMRTLVQPVTAAAGAAGTAGRSAGVTIHHQDVNLPAAPGHDQMGDPRHQAALFAREMRRRGWR